MEVVPEMFVSKLLKLVNLSSSDNR